MATRKAKEEDVASDAVETVADAKVATKAHVHASTGGHIRTYDDETHGPEFHELAKEYVETHTKDGKGPSIVLE